MIELNSGSPSFDVIHISYHVQKRQFEKANWLADLSQIMKNPELTEASLTESDFSQAGLALRQEPAGPAPVAALLRRLLDALLEQGAFRQEGPVLSRNV